MHGVTESNQCNINVAPFGLVYPVRKKYSFMLSLLVHHEMFMQRIKCPTKELSALN